MDIKKDEELGPAIHSLIASFEAEAKAEALPHLLSVLTEYNHLDFTKAEHVNLALTLSFDSYSRVFVDHVLKFNGLEAHQRQNLHFFFRHYNFVSCHLDSIIQEKEGHACHVDKTRTLINAYVDFVLTGATPLIDHARYYWPNHGTLQEWMDYINSIRSLYYGNEEDYVRYKAVLLAHYPTAP